MIRNGIHFKRIETRTESNGNSADVCKRKDDRPVFPEIARHKTITDNRKFRKKRSKKYAQNSGGEVLEPLKAPNVLKEKKITISTEL